MTVSQAHIYSMSLKLVESTKRALPSGHFCDGLDSTQEQTTDERQRRGDCQLRLSHGNILPGMEASEN